VGPIKLRPIGHVFFTARGEYHRNMNAVLLIVSVVLPLLPVVMFPTRFIGRGLGATAMGAALLVGMMMVLYLSLSAATRSSGGAGAVAADLPSVSDADLRALKDLLD
jgi:hypothetical protein